MFFKDKKTVLLVEDHKFTAKTEKTQLEKFNYNVIINYTGEEAIKTVETNDSIDLILMDIDLGSGIDGIEAGRQILKIRNLPIVFITSNVNPKIIRKTESVSTYGYVVKGTSFPVIDAAIKMAFKLFNEKQISGKYKNNLKKSIKRNQNFFENTILGIGLLKIVFDDKNKPVDYIFIHVNSAFEKHTGLNANDVVGKKITDVIPNIKNTSFIDNYNTLVFSKQPVEFEQHFSDLDKLFKIKAFQLDDVSFATFFENITKQKKTEDDLRESEKMLKEAHQIAKMGRWDYFHKSNKLVWSDTVYKIFDIDKEKFGASYECFLNAIHPEDREMVANAWLTSLKDKEDYQIDHRLLLKDGTVKWVTEKCSTVFDENGNPLKSVGIVQDITDRKKVEKKLIIAKEEALVANKAKSEFLSNMSHEIRTPLNSVIGFTELLKNTKLSKVQKEYVENANISAHSLLDIITDILDFSKIESGKLELEFIKSDIIQIVEDATDIVKYQASNKGLELLINIAVNVPHYAVVDPVRLKQILVNLLSNAVKFTEKGEVEIKVNFSKSNDTNGKFYFEIRDTGIGISDDQKKKLFKSFSQADTSTTRKFGGTGLGLIISDLLAKLMKSQIELFSIKNQGSKFYFTIETEFYDEPLFNHKEIKDVNRVLVVDDNIKYLNILQTLFDNWNIDFTGCENALSSLKTLETKEPFDLVIVDYNMPYINGIETIKMIREQLKLSSDDLPVILSYNYTDEITVYEESKKYGVCSRLLKPVKPKNIFNLLKNFKNLLSDKVSDEYIIQTNNESVSNIEKFNKDAKYFVLLVEDTEMNMILLKTIVESYLENITIFEARNGIEAINIYNKYYNTIDIIIMDIQMPEMDGVSATKKIRELEKNNKVVNPVPIIALTAGAKKEEKNRCLNAGMNDFLTKPVEIDSIKNIFLKYLSVEKNNYSICENIDSNFHFDKRNLLRKMNNNKLHFNLIIDKTLEIFPDYLTTLRSAIDKNEIETIKCTLHNMKGAVLTMSFKYLSEIVIDMYENFNSKYSVLSDAYEKISAEWDIVKKLIEESKID